jgi:hypothetical protein
MATKYQVAPEPGLFAFFLGEAHMNIQHLRHALFHRWLWFHDIKSSQVKLMLSPKQRENKSVSGHAKMPPASHQVSAASLKLLIQQIHPHVRVELDSGMCVARDLYELWGRSPYTRMFVARTSH